MSKKAELISNYFPTIYLTVISLLQGIALSQLVPSLITYFGIAEHPWTDIRLVPIILMLLIIFIVWHHYAIGIFFLRWFPNIIDTIIPFMVSIGQFMLISYLTIKTSVDDIQLIPWTKGLTAFMVLGSCTYFAAAWRLDPLLFVNIMSKKNSYIHHALTKSLFIKAGFSILVQGVFAGIIALTEQLWMLWIEVVLFLTHLIGFELILLFEVKKHYVEAMDDFEANGYKD